MSKPPLRARPVDNETKQVSDAPLPSTVVASAPTTHRYVFSRTMRHHQQQTDPQHVLLLRMIAASSPYASSSASGGGRAPLGPVRRTSRPSETSNISVMRSSSASSSSSSVTATAPRSTNARETPHSSSPPLPAVVKTFSTMDSGSNVGRKRSSSLQGPAPSIVDPPQQAHRTQALPGTSRSANFETHNATVASSSASTAANSLPPYRNPVATNSARRRSSSNDHRLVPPLPTNVTAVPSHSKRASLPMPKQTTSFLHSTKNKSYRQKKSDPSEDYCCAICAQLFLDVVRIESCDHRFCATCLFHARVGNRCPLCRRMFTFGEMGRRTVALSSQGQSERERGPLRNNAAAGSSSGGGVVLDPMTMVMVKLYSTQKHHHEASSSIWQTLQHSTEEGDETERRGNRAAVVDELTARQFQLEQGITASVRGRDRWQRFWYAQLLQSYSTSQQRAMNARLLAAPSPHDSFVLSISNMQLFWLCLHVAAYIVERYLPPADDEPKSSSSPSEGEVLSEPLRAFLVEMIHVYDHLQDFGDEVRNSSSPAAAAAAATTNRPQGGGTRNPLVVSNTLQSFFLIGADQCRSDASDRRRRSAVDLAYFDSLIDCSNEFLRQQKTAGLTAPHTPQEDPRAARSSWVRSATSWTDSAMHFFFLSSRPSVSVAGTTQRQKTCNEDATVLRACSQGVQRLVAALDLPSFEEGDPVEFLSEDTTEPPVVHVWEWWADIRRPPSTAAGTESSPTASSVTSSSFSNSRLSLESVRSREIAMSRGNTTSLSSSEPHTPCGVTLELHRLSTRTFPSPSVALSILQSGSVFSTNHPHEDTRMFEKEEDDALTSEFIKQLATEWLFRHHMSAQQQQGGGCTRGTTLPIKTALYDPETQPGHSKNTPSIVWVHQNGYMRRRQLHGPQHGDDDERTLAVSDDVEGGRGGGEGETVVISSDSSTNRFRPGQYPPPSLQDDDNGLMTLDDDEEHELDWIGGKEDGSHRRVVSLAGPSLPPSRLPRLMSADSRHQADLRDAVKRASAQAHMMKLERR